LAADVIKAGAEILIIQGTIVSAEHVQASGEALNLKSFIADLDVPVIVGGCTNYRTATHLMRTGAAGVIVGTGGGITSTTDAVLGIRVPMATAIADAAAARRSYLDETGGRYVHVIAAGEIDSSADIAKAIACGADAVMVGEPLAEADIAPAGGWYWPNSAAHPVLPRGFAAPVGNADVPLDRLLHGPAVDAEGRSSLFGGLRRAMGKAGYSELKEFQKVGLSVRL
jgi:IMP dehydrogenase